MNRAITLLAALCAPPLLLWLATGFVLWNWNPGEWSEAARFYATLISVSTMVPSVGIWLENT
jgi:hypothetical protein